MKPNLRKPALAISAALTLALAAGANAVEGMWTPEQLPDIERQL